MSEIVLAAALGGGIAVVGGMVTSYFGLKSQRIAAGIERERMEAAALLEDERARNVRVVGERRNAYLAYIEYATAASLPRDPSQLREFYIGAIAPSTHLQLVSNRDAILPVFDSLEYVQLLAQMCDTQGRGATDDELDLYHEFLNHAVNHMRIDLGFAGAWRDDPTETLSRMREQAASLLGVTTIGSMRPLRKRPDS